MEQQDCAILKQSDDMLNKDFSQMNFHPKIVLIYALLSLKMSRVEFARFLIQKLKFCRLFARLTPVFLLKKRPSFAHRFTKASPSEEFFTRAKICTIDCGFFCVLQIFRQNVEQFMVSKNFYNLLCNFLEKK